MGLKKRGGAEKRSKCAVCGELTGVQRNGEPKGIRGGKEAACVD